MFDVMALLGSNALLLVSGALTGSVLALASRHFHPGYSATQWLSAWYYSGSRCVICHASFLWRDKLPLIGWLRLRGKCRFCQHSSGQHAPFFEVIMALLCILIVNAVDDAYIQLLLVAATALLLLLSAIDQRHQLLPDILVYLLLWLGLFRSLLMSSALSPGNAIIGAMAGYGSLWLLAALYRGWRAWDGLGNGDMKLFAALGAWCGWPLLPLIAVVATLSALATVLLARLTVYRLNSKNLSISYDMNSPLPFGPYLAVAGWGVMMFHTLSQNPVTPV